MARQVEDLARQTDLPAPITVTEAARQGVAGSRYVAAK